MLRMRMMLLLGMVCSLWATPALAADGVVLKLTAQKEVTVVNKHGKKVQKFIVPDHVEPGDTILYTIDYHNKGNKEAEHIVINDPIPKSTVYILDSAFGKGALVLFSVDGEHFSSASTLMVKEGKNKRLARVDEYHFVRWALQHPVKKGKQGKVGFKARVK